MKKILWMLSAACLLFSWGLDAAELSNWKDFGTTPDRARLADILQKSLKAYESVRDYKAVFQKQEKSGEALGPQETIFLKFEKPFKIFMGWMNTQKKGLQVLYERGKHEGKLAVHKPGLLFGLAPLIFLDPKSPWVREGSESYDIEDAGIGSFLDDFSAAVIRAAEENKLKVSVSPDAGGDTVDVTFADSQEDQGYFAYRVFVHFDGRTSLPDNMKLYDWHNHAMGIYSYEQLKLNVGTEDAEFRQLAQHQLYKFFSSSELSTIKIANFARSRK